MKGNHNVMRLGVVVVKADFCGKIRREPVLTQVNVDPASLL
jgi:hypothetical protein